MQAFRTENNYRNASRLSAAELRAAMASREILQSTALAFDTQRQLRFELSGCRAVMPFGQCADGADTGSVRDIAGGTPHLLRHRGHRHRRKRTALLPALPGRGPADVQGRIPRPAPARRHPALRRDPHRAFRRVLRRGLRHQRSPAHRLYVGEPHLLPRRPGQRGAADPLRHQEPGRAGAVRADHPGAAGPRMPPPLR